MPDDTTTDDTVDVDSSDVLIVLGLVLVTVALTALFGWAIACLVDGITIAALGIIRAARLGPDRQ